jgi:dTDP-4-amino-4,6-dideoxygalactose transaminase
LGPGDEVIIPAYTFCATAIPFGMTGARIVWADMHPGTWVMDPADVEKKITPRTKAIVAVHLLGMPVDMPAIMRIAQAHGLRVVEDCAQAPGAAINGQKVGTFGDFGCFSFHGAKNLTTLGEGGMLSVRSDEDAALVPGLRHNGVRPFPPDRHRYWVPAMTNVGMDLPDVWPNNFCIGEAQCALGSAALKNLDAINDTLIAQAVRLRAALADVPELSLVHIPGGYRHVFHQLLQVRQEPGRPAGFPGQRGAHPRHRSVPPAVSLSAVPRPGCRRARLSTPGRLVGQLLQLPMVGWHARGDARLPGFLGQGRHRQFEGEIGADKGWFNYE